MQMSCNIREEGVVWGSRSSMFLLQCYMQRGIKISIRMYIHMCVYTIYMYIYIYIYMYNRICMGKLSDVCLCEGFR